MRTIHEKTNNIISKSFKNQAGNLAVTQVPNLPLIVGLTGNVLAMIFQRGILHNLCSIVGFGALFTWAWLELFQGINYFRRLLGFGVLVLIILRRVM